MDIEIDELLTLLSERVQAEMASTKIEEERFTELRWLFKQQEYVLASVREIFEELVERIDELEDIILSTDKRRASLKRQLTAHYRTLNGLEEARAERADEINIGLNHRIEAVQMKIAAINEELTGIETKTFAS